MRVVLRPSRQDLSARLRKNANQSIPHNTVTAVTWQIEDYDTSGFFDPAQPTRILVPVSRRLALVGGLNFDVNAIGIRRGFFRLNGLTTLGITTMPAVGAPGVGTTFQVVEERRFVQGDYLELMAFQTSGGALNLTVPSAFLATHV